MQHTQKMKVTNDSLDECKNIIETSGSGQDVFVEDESPYSTESGVGGDDETWNMTDENPVIFFRFIIIR